MSHFHNIGELAELWEFGHEEALYDRVISRGRLKVAFHYSGFVQPSGAAKTTEPFLINGPVYIHERSTPNESFRYVWSITAVAATLGTSSEQKIYPDYDGTSKCLILEEPCLVGSDELLIAHEDAVTFAKEHGLSQPEISGVVAERPLDSRERRSLLRLIGALVEMVLGIEDSDVSPDFNRLALQLEEHLPESSPADATEAIIASGRERLLESAEYPEGRTADRQSLLCVTGALATLYISQVGGQRLLHPSGEPNRNQLADRIERHLALRGLDAEGLRARTLADKLKQAFEVLESV